jgi:hypothetical protein
MNKNPIKFEDWRQAAQTLIQHAETYGNEYGMRYLIDKGQFTREDGTPIGEDWEIIVKRLA